MEKVRAFYLDHVSYEASWGVFSPDSSAMSGWEIFLFVVIVYQAFMIPLKISFDFSWGVAEEPVD